MHWTGSANCSEAWILSFFFFSQTVLFLQSFLFRWKMFSFHYVCGGWMCIMTSGKWLSTTGTKTWRKLVSKQSNILFQLRAEQHLRTSKKACCFETLRLPRVNHGLFVVLNWQKVRSEVNLVASITHSLRYTMAPPHPTNTVTLFIKDGLISGVNLEVWLITFLSLNLSSLEYSLTVFNCIFFFCTYKFSLLLLLNSVTLTNIEIARFIYCKWYAKKKKSFSVLSCYLLFLKFERQTCSYCNCVSSPHFLLEMVLFCLSSGHHCEGLWLACSLWTTAVCFALWHVCLEFDQMTL